jgi:predicted kinase
MIKPRLYLFVGYPGAGKTTVSKHIETLTGAYHIWADHERSNMFKKPTHSPLESTQLYKYLNLKTEGLLAEGKSVIFDTNFNFKADRDYLRDIASMHDAEMLIIWITTPKDLSRQRATHDDHRQKNGYHEVMSLEDFERLSDHVQEPGEDENFVTINGTDINPEELYRILGKTESA